MAKGNGDCCGKQVGNGKVSAEYMRKYAKDVKYFEKQYKLDNGMVKDMAKKENVPVRVIYRKARKDPFSKEKIEMMLFGELITVDKRYVVEYGVGEEVEKIEGKCVWISDNLEYFDLEYFDFEKVMLDVRQLKCKFVKKIKGGNKVMGDRVTR